MIQKEAIEPKTYTIIKLLLEENGAFTLKEIASRLGMAEKTLRSRNKAIKDLLSQNGLQMQSVRGKGSKICGESTARLNLLASLSETESQYLQSRERVHIILYWLLALESPCRMHLLEETLFASRSSLQKDLKRVREWLWNYQIELVCNRKQGIFALAGEKRFRHALTRLLIEVLPDEYNQFPREFKKAFSELNDPLCPENKMMAQFLDILQQKSGLELIPEEILRLKFQFLFSLRRIAEGNKVTLQTHTYRKIMDTFWPALVRTNLSQLNHFFGIRPNDIEIAYLSGLLISARFITSDSKGQDLLLSKAQLITERFLAILLKSCKISDIEPLKRGLVQHIYGVLHRTEYIWESKNPIKDHIKREFPQAFQLAKEIVHILDEFVPNEIPDDEIAFIAMHIMAAIERSKKPLKAIFLFENYYSEVKLAQAMIENLTNQVLFERVIHCKDLTPELYDEADIIFTTSAKKNDKKPSFLIPLIPDSEFLNKLQSEISMIHAQINTQKIFVTNIE
ncbi:MAG: PRD domain-containing protein [Anaerolineaceae bacterium]|nr:PRD domain-containing protein [Anaerolineaceae bacterium]